MKFVSAAVPESETVIIQVKFVPPAIDSWTYYSRCHKDHATQYIKDVKKHSNVVDARIEPEIQL